MPHSNQGSADAHSTCSLESWGRVTTAHSSKPTDASSLSGKSQVAPAANARNRRSLPAELAGSTNFSDFMRKQLQPRESVMAAYNSTSSRRRTQYYDEHFQYKDGSSRSIRERVQRDSPIVVELRTNVIIKDEFTLVTDLSYHLAARYTRPDSAVMVKVDHSACLAMGGTFEPCYIMSITAVPSQMGPTMNKRNAALIQSFLADILSVSPDRGVLKFQPIPEENFATNGTTMLGEIERLEKRLSGENSGGVRRAMNSMGRKSIPSFKKSIPKMNGETKPESESKSAAAEPRPPTARTDSAAPSNISDDQQETPSQMSATITSPCEVYELPATEIEQERPVTAHKRKSSSGTSGGSNGLRMNGVSNGALGAPVRTTTPKVAKKSRPRTFSGESPSVQDQIKSKSIPLTTAAAATRAPVQLSAVPQSKKERPSSFLKHDPANTVAKASPNNTSRPTTPRPKSSGIPPVVRPRDSLHASVTGMQTTPKPLNGWTNESAQDKSRRKIEKLTGENFDERKDTEANTAKRRSTITATPKFPEPPPIPVDRQDSKSLKVGKRKSFLSAFKRNAPLAQPVL